MKERRKYWTLKKINIHCDQLNKKCKKKDFDDLKESQPRALWALIIILSSLS